jgi:hypothetical protein
MHFAGRLDNRTGERNYRRLRAVLVRLGQQNGTIENAGIFISDDALRGCENSNALNQHSVGK